jgi:PKHD-type hydroxylase
MMGFENILTDEELATIREFLAGAPFVDGKYSAAASVAKSKNNLQLQPGTEGEDLVGRVVIDALLRNEVFRTWAKPLHLTPPIFARYQPGMRYGAHVDSPVLGGGRPLRSDLSVTIFLSDVADYDGGELAIEIPGGMRHVKLPAGSAFVYSTRAVHQVCEVTRGERMVAVLWLQSMIRDPHIRDILFDMEAAITSLEERPETTKEAMLLQKSLSNLRRHFTEI